MRRVLWISALTLAFAGGAVIGSQLGDSDTPTARRDARPERPLLDVEREALVVGRRFVAWAVPVDRDAASLAKAWEILHAKLKRDCRCSRERWLTGDIPIMPYPIREPRTVPFRVQNALDDHVVLHTRLFPEGVPKTQGMTFFLGLRAAGRGAARRWLVDYWAPALASLPPRGPGG